MRILSGRSLATQEKAQANFFLISCVQNKIINTIKKTCTLPLGYIAHLASNRLQ
jgi:hypothetical protein